MQIKMGTAAAISCKTILNKITMTVIAGLFLLAGGGAHGQDVRASLGGNVTNPKGAVVPKTTVVLTADETGVVETTTTNGNYTIKSVKTGLMLDVAGASSLKGVGIVQMPAKAGYANQQWSFQPNNSNQKASLTNNVNANQQ